MPQYLDFNLNCRLYFKSIRYRSTIMLINRLFVLSLAMKYEVLVEFRSRI